MNFWERNKFEISVVGLFLCLAISLCLSIFAPRADGAKLVNENIVELGPFNGGINSEVERSQIPGNQLYLSENFLWHKNRLQVREGFFRLLEPMSPRPLLFMDIFKKRQGGNYLMLSDGVNLWARSNVLDTAIALNFGRANASTVDYFNGSPYIYGNSIADQRWLTVFGHDTVTFSLPTGDVQAVILLDTLAKAVSNFDADSTAQEYNVDYANIAVTGGITLVDQYWIYSNVGKFFFADIDSFVIVDSLAGDRWSADNGYLASWGGDTLFAFKRSGSPSWAGKNFTGYFCQFTSNPKSANGDSSAVPAGHTLAMSWPVAGNTYTTAFLTGGAIMPAVEETGGYEYCNLVELAYDSTSLFSITADSIRVHTLDRTLGGSETGKYVRIWCDSCGWDADSTWFETGDWFLNPEGGTTNISKWTQYRNCVPVCGMFVHDSLSSQAVFAGHPGVTTGTDTYLNDSDTAVVSFFRMRRPTWSNQNTGVKFAMLYNDQVFEVRYTDPRKVWYSEVFEPDSFLPSSWILLDNQYPIVVGALQYGEPIFYTAVNVWKLTTSGGLYYKEKINGTRGCIAARSLLNIDGVHYGLASDGYWESTNGEPVLISQAVQSFFTDSLALDRLDEVVSGYDAEYDDIWITIPTTHGATTRNTLVYNRPTKSWWPQTFDASYYYGITDIDISDSLRFLAAGTDSSIILARGYRDDDGVALEGILWTGDINFALTSSAKRVRNLWLTYETADTIGTILRCYRDYPSSGDSPTYNLLLQLLPDRLRRHFRLNSGNWRGLTLSMYLDVLDASQLKIPRIEIDVVEDGKE